jgi:CBS domain-containing protein
MIDQPDVQALMTQAREHLASDDDKEATRFLTDAASHTRDHEVEDQGRKGPKEPMSAVGSDGFVRDLMTRELVTCSRDADLGRVASTMVRRHVQAVFVLGEAGRPEGVVSDFDMLAGEWLGCEQEDLSTMKSMTAGELMTSPLETIDADATLAAAADRMRELHLGRLVVTGEQGAALGVISVSDLVAPLGRERVARRTVRDVMSYAIVTCAPETELAAAARAMTEHHSRSIIVIDEAGQAVGVITGNDLLSLYESTQPATTANDLMNHPITCDIDLPLQDAIDLILCNEIHRVVVTDSSAGDAAPVGVLSTSDVIREMAQEGSVWQVG